LFIPKKKTTIMKKQLLSLFALAVASVASAQTINNAGYENWGTQLGEDQQPTSWISYNIFTAPLIDPTNSNPTSVTQAGAPDNYQGTYSAKITTVTLITNPDVNNIPFTAGFLMVGAVSFSSPFMLAGYASTGRPAAFDYATKYQPTGIDTAFAVVTITKWNGTSRDTIAWGFDYITTAIPSYTVRSITLNHNPAMLNVTPDTTTIIFSASSFNSPQVGSTMYVDALSFSGYVGISENEINKGVSVYPNPSNTEAYFDFVSEEAAGIAIYDMTGREVSRSSVFNKRASVDASQMNSGMYTYAVLNTDGAVMSRGKFSVSH
jgi:Secretion system C-terminal sorting domain